MTVTDTRFAPRPFFCPIESAIHPEVDAIERRAVDWIDRVGLPRDGTERARTIGTNSAEFYARFAPRGIARHVELAARWVYWGFVFDDARCDSGWFSTRPADFVAMAGVLQRALESPRIPVETSDRYVRALQDIGRALLDCATPVQFRRFVEAHRAWLFGVAWQIGNRAREHMPSVDEYLAMRLASCGGPPTIALLEIANGMEVPAAEMDSPQVRALTEMTWLIAGLDNDLHSYRKERRQRHTDQNIITVLMHHEPTSIEPALTSAIAIRDRIMTLFLRLRAQLLPDASEPLRRYLTDLGHAIRGNIEWAHQVPRYTSRNGQATPSVPSGQPRWTDHPADPDAAALPFPTIGWWWTQPH